MRIICWKPQRFRFTFFVFIDCPHQYHLFFFSLIMMAAIQDLGRLLHNSDPWLLLNSSYIYICNVCIYIYEGRTHCLYIHQSSNSAVYKDINFLQESSSCFKKLNSNDIRQLSLFYWDKSFVAKKDDKLFDLNRPILSQRSHNNGR